ncbi:MAG TPA: hypothetical protein VNM48_16535 [Chloroflexota bacterium]|nr:hypothetical protein [Chloroflexota bacterium]
MARVFLPTGYFRDTAVVYTENATTGAFDSLIKSGLACRLEVISRREAGATGPDRAELGTIRELYSDPDYDLKTNGRYGQIEIGGERWNPEPNSFFLEKHHDGTPLYWRCDLTGANP